MIKNFKCKDTKKLFERNITRKFSKKIHKIILRKLLIIDAAIELNDLKIPPGNRLEKLTADRKGQHSIRINNQLRICFKWKNGNTYNLEAVDYH